MKEKIKSQEWLMLLMVLQSLKKNLGCMLMRIYLTNINLTVLTKMAGSEEKQCIASTWASIASTKFLKQESHDWRKQLLDEEKRIPWACEIAEIDFENHDWLGRLRNFLLKEELDLHCKKKLVHTNFYRRTLTREKGKNGNSCHRLGMACSLAVQMSKTLGY